MILRNQFMERIGWVTLAMALFCLALLLSGLPADAQINCRMIMWSDPAVQMSFVSKQCWVTPDQVEIVKAPVIPRAKPLIQTAPLAKHKTKIAKLRKSACGSKRQVWRKLKNGHRMYRCK